MCLGISYIDIKHIQYTMASKMYMEPLETKRRLQTNDAGCHFLDSPITVLTCVVLKLH